MTTDSELSKRPVSVIGGGTMGRRIALMFLTRGGTVRIYDPDDDSRNAAQSYIGNTLSDWVDTRRSADDAPDDVVEGTLETSSDLGEAVKDAWLIVEAVPENPDLKRKILAQLDEVAASDAVIATNSSSYRSDLLIDDVKHPERVMNLHFQMPPDLLAVELMTDGQTDDTLINRVADEVRTYGLEPYVARKPSTGLILNRVWAAIKRESLKVVAEGVADPEDVDGLFRAMFNTEVGPFQLMDRVGLDVVLDIEKNYASEDPHLSKEPRELLQKYIDAGDLGEKTGRGFYDHSSKS